MRTPPTFRLVASSSRSLSFDGGVGGGGDLQLSMDKPTRIGRAPDNDVKLPPDWIQISSKHCCIAYDAARDVWMVTDLSTNGTFINGQRIGKGKEAAARVGDRVQLSCVDPKAPGNHMEYVLRRVDGSHEATTSVVQPSPAVAAPTTTCAALVTPKRKHSGPSDNGAADTTTKRSKTAPSSTIAAPGGTTPITLILPASASAAKGGGAASSAAAGTTGGHLQALLKLQENNQTLMRELDDARVQHEEAEQHLKEEAAAAKRREAAAQAAANDKVKDANERVQQMEADLMAVRHREMTLQMDAEAAKKTVAAMAEEACKAHEATRRERECREATEARCAALEAKIAAARNAQQGSTAAAQAARAEAEALQAGMQAAQWRAAELVAALEAAQAEVQQQRWQVDGLQRQVAEERQAKEAAEGQLDSWRALAEEAKRYIGSLETKERLLQNDRLLVNGCLATLQRGNQRSRAANQRITDAFAALQEAKAEADGIMEAQCEQCSQICAKLTVSSSSLLAQPSPAQQVQARLGMLVGTQEVLAVGTGGMFNPARVPLTAPPPAQLGTPVEKRGVAATAVAAEQEEMEVQAEELAEAAGGEEEQQKRDDKMEDAEDEGPAVAAAGTTPAAKGQSEGQPEGQQGTGSGAASTPAPTPAVPADGLQELVVENFERQQQPPPKVARVTLAATETMDLVSGQWGTEGEAVDDAGNAAAAAEAVAVAVAGVAENDGNTTTEGPAGSPLAADDSGAAAAAAAAGDEVAGLYSGGTAPAASGPREVVQVEEEGEAAAAYEGETEQPAGEGFIGLLAEGSEQGEQETEQQEEEPVEAEEAVEAAAAEDGAAHCDEEDMVEEEEEVVEGAPARDTENDGNLDNLAGTQNDSTMRSLLSKVPESEPQQQDSGAAAVAAPISRCSG